MSPVQAAENERPDLCLIDTQSPRVAVATRTAHKLPKPKRITFALEANARARNLYGADVYSQIMWMRFDGLTVGKIAEALECSPDLVGSIISFWQQQITLRERNFKPRRYNRRRWKKRDPATPAGDATATPCKQGNPMQAAAAPPQTPTLTIPRGIMRAVAVMPLQLAA